MTNQIRQGSVEDMEIPRRKGVVTKKKFLPFPWAVVGDPGGRSEKGREEDRGCPVSPTHYVGFLFVVVPPLVFRDPGEVWETSGHTYLVSFSSTFVAGRVGTRSLQGCLGTTSGVKSSKLLEGGCRPRGGRDQDVPDVSHEQSSRAILQTGNEVKTEKGWLGSFGEMRGGGGKTLEKQVGGGKWSGQRTKG